MTLKKIAGQLHLWLGLASGIVIVIIALTGAIYAFEPELNDAFKPYLHVQKESRPFLPLSAIKQKAEQQLPGKKVSRITYEGGEHSVAVSFNKKEQYYYIVYINPYTAEVLQVKNMDHDFFRLVLLGHMHLWLPDPLGHSIIVFSTLIFAIIIITGIVLWWPKKWNKASRKNSFRVKLDASPKRLNYDLHNVLGFYASWILIFIVLTGLVWGFDGVRNAEHWLFSGGKPYPAVQKLQSEKQLKGVDRQMPAVDSIELLVHQQYPAVTKYSFQFPPDEKGVIGVRVFPDEHYTYNIDNLAFDQFTAKEYPVTFRGKYANAGTGEMAYRLNFDIHTGSIGRLPLRIAVFFAALITASLPVTGFYIWWGKQKKKKKKV